MDEPLNDDLTLYARFKENESDTVMGESTETFLSDVANTYRLIIESTEALTSANLSTYLSVEVLTGDMPVLTVETDANGYAVYPTTEYTAGGMYRFLLMNGALSYYGQEDSVRQFTIQVHKEPVKIVEMSEKGVKYIDKNDLIIPMDNNTVILPASIFEEKDLKVGDTLCIGNGVDLSDSDTVFVNIDSYVAQGDKYSLAVYNSSLDDVVGEVDVFFEEGVDLDEDYLDANLDAVVNDLYDSDAVQQLTSVLALALAASRTVEEMGDGTPLYEPTDTAFSDNAKITSGVQGAVQTMIPGLTITARYGRASNTNFANPRPANWNAIEIEFEYEATLKNKVKIKATLTITEYINISMQGYKRGSGSNIRFNYALNLYSQTDIILTVLVCSASEDDDAEDKDEEEYEDISLEIEQIMSGEEESDPDNIVAKMNEYLDAEGDYIELYNLPLLSGSYSVIPQIPVFSINCQLDFVVKVCFAAGISTKLSILDAVQVGIKGDTSNRSVSSYKNELLGANRYSLDIYACGYIGFKVGLSTTLTLSFNGLKDLGEIGAEFEVGVYIDIYGYLHFHLAKNYQYGTTVEKSISGGVYIEVGLYFEINLIARAEAFKFSAEANIAEVKIPLFSIGNKYVLLELEADLSSVFMHKNTLNIKDIPMLSAKYLDITTGDVIEQSTDVGKIYLRFPSRYFKFDEETGNITVRKELIGRYDDGLESGDSVIETKMIITFCGHSMNFGSMDVYGNSILGTVDFVWIDESLDMEVEDIGKAYVATINVNCDGEVFEHKKIEGVAGMSIGGVDIWNVITVYQETTGWDVNPNKYALDSDKTFTFYVTRKQVRVGFMYYDDGEWVAEVKAVALNGTPSVSANAEDSYGDDMEFVGWTGYRAKYAHASVINDRFTGIQEVPEKIFGYATNFVVVGYDEDEVIEKVTGTKEEVLAFLYDDLTYRSACFYIADYIYKQYNVTVSMYDRNNQYQDVVYAIDYGSSANIYRHRNVSSSFNLIGWDWTGDGEADCADQKDLPLVKADQHLVALYKQKECIMHLYDYKQDWVEDVVNLYGNLDISMLDKINTATVPGTSGAELAGYNFSYDNENWWFLDDVTHNVAAFYDMHIYPVFKYSYEVVIDSDNGTLNLGESTASHVYVEGTLIRPFTEYYPRKDDTNSESYVISGWIDTLNDNKEYTLYEEIEVTGNMHLKAKYTVTNRLYTLTIGATYGIVPGSDMSTVSFENLTYAEMLAKKEYYENNLPADVTKDDIVYHFTSAIVSEANGTVSVNYSYTQDKAKHPLIFDTGEGAFKDGTTTCSYDDYFTDQEYPLNVIPFPTRESNQYIYEFTGWEDEEGVFYSKDRYYKGPGDVTLTAVYENKGDRIYTITFKTAHGMFSNAEMTYVIEGTYEEAVTGIPEYPIDNYLYESYTYSCTGWDAEVPTTFTTNVEINAEWIQVVRKITITYYLDGEVYGTQEYEFGDPVNILAAPGQDILKGNVFSGWSWSATGIGGSSEAVPTTMPRYDLDARGTIIKYYVIYVVDGHETKRENIAVGNVVNIEDLPTLTGYTYSAWDVSGATAIDNSFTMPEANVTISSSKVINTHQVIYKVDGEQYGVPTTYDYNAKVTVQNPLSKTGHGFSGWTTTDANVVDGEFTMPDCDVVINGTYTINNYKVYYYVDNVLKYTDEFAYNTLCNVRADEVVEGKLFSGWQSSSVNVEDGKFTLPAADVEFRGSLSSGSHTITYYIDGEVWTTQNADYNQQVTLLDPVIGVGRTFVSWTCADATISDNKLTMPAQDIDIYGTTVATQYTITYLEKAGGDILDTAKYESGQAVTLSDTYLRRGKISNGWTVASGDVEIVDNGFEMPAENVTLIATWDVCFTIDNGSVYEKYDTESPSFNYEYNSDLQMLSITDSGLTLSGSISDILIYIYADTITFSNLTVSSSVNGYYYTMYENDSSYGDTVYNCYTDAAIIIDSSIELAITLVGTNTITKTFTEGTENEIAAITSIDTTLPYHDMMEGLTFIESQAIYMYGSGDDAKLVINSDQMGIYTLCKLEMNDIQCEIDCESAALKGFGIYLNNVDLAVNCNREVAAIMAAPSVTMNDCELSFTDSTIDIEGQITSNYDIIFNGATSGTIISAKYETVSASNQITFNLDAGNSITMEIVNPEANYASIILTTAEGVVSLQNDNTYIVPSSVVYDYPYAGCEWRCIGTTTGSVFTPLIKVEIGHPNA